MVAAHRINNNFQAGSFEIVTAHGATTATIDSFGFTCFFFSLVSMTTIGFLYKNRRKGKRDADDRLAAIGTGFKSSLAPSSGVRRLRPLNGMSL